MPRPKKKAGSKADGLIRQKHGGAIWQGAPANPVAGTGRPPDAFKQLCRDLASGAMTMQALADVLADRSDTKFVAALRYVTEYGYGKVPDQVNVDQNVTHYVANVPAKGSDRTAWQRTYSQK